MAITQQGNRVYAKITDLQEESILNDGDKIIFHCDSTGNASLIDYSNFKIDLDHVTFGDTFSSMLNFTQTAGAWVDTMTESFNEIEEKCNEVVELTTNMTNEMSAIKMLFQMLLGLAFVRSDGQTNYPPDIYISSLSKESQDIFEEIIKDVNLASGLEIDFTLHNILRLASAAASVESINQQIDSIQAQISANNNSFNNSISALSARVTALEANG